MKTIKLPKTGIQFNIEDCFYYHDHGAVDSLILQTKALEERYKIPLEKTSRLQLLFERTPLAKTYWSMTKNDPIRGYHWIFYPSQYRSEKEALSDGAEVNSHTYVHNVLGGEGQVFCRGHEETHILIRLGKIALLEKELENLGIRSESLRNLDTENICDAGGFCALLKEYRGHKEIKMKKITIRKECANWISQNSHFTMEEK